jgi:phosphoribosylglycinamide formyltransferase-1
MFVDDHHADGRIAVWCKAAHDEQRTRVSDAPDRFFVPPYVGVRGWVGVRLDRPDSDWIDLAILLERGWADVVPPSVVKAGVKPQSPPPVRPRTDAARAKAALERLTSVCLALPEAVLEREGRHATFAVGKKAFAYFLDNHHGDARIGVCVRTPLARAESLARREPKRFYLPAYIGRRGWLGVRVDAARVDWADVTSRLGESYRSVAPKRLLKAL